MKGINKVMLVGHLGKDPQVRYLNSGTAVANFPLATTEMYKNKKGEKVQETEWHNIVVWRNLAEIVEKFLKKGSFIYMDGKLRTRSWEDKNGNMRYTTEVIGDKMVMLDKKGGKIEEVPESEKAPTEEVVAEEPVDDLPF